jgi:flagellar motor switch protein FliM
MDLRCGDVLRLPQRLDQGIAVLCEGKMLAHALLGETQGRKSVQLFADLPSERALR